MPVEIVAAHAKRHIHIDEIKVCMEEGFPSIWDPSLRVLELSIHCLRRLLCALPYDRLLSRLARNRVMMCRSDRILGNDGECYVLPILKYQAAKNKHPF